MDRRTVERKYKSYSDNVVCEACILGREPLRTTTVMEIGKNRLTFFLTSKRRTVRQ